MMAFESSPRISIIIPCWNEEKNLRNGALDEVDQYVSSQDYAWEVIVVNDGSTDRSRELIECFTASRKHFFLHNIVHGGKPAGVWAGIQQARGEIVLFADMDQSTPIGELGKLLPWFEQGFDVVIGSRGAARDGSSMVRKAGSVVFLTLRRSLLLKDILDTQCGFKSMRRQVALEVFPRLQYFSQAEVPTGWKVSAYDVELLYLLDSAGYAIKEVVVNWRNRDQSDSKSQQGELTRYFNESMQMAREIARIKLNQHRGEYLDAQADNGAPKTNKHT